MTEIVQPQHTNFHGTIFGGVVMSWIDTAAAIAAYRHAETVCVTASIDELHFLHPVWKGDIVNIQSRITCVHKTSCEVHVKVTSENPTRQEKKVTADALLTFVSVGRDGRPCPMPGLILETEEDKKLHKEALLRKEHREKFRKSLLAST